eukprot:TRINITY_DN4974_c0_g1_i2.p1 TRINITY_DN4974_c0_g1~~TRINITY_DN4974_c0_g1_i2.p1  ORF type:complete len:933 (+),score=179.81 TRINITY_DN4974_c0_g1_i2:629-3427(+)
MDAEDNLHTEERTYRYWIPLEDVTQFKLKVAKHLPVFSRHESQGVNPDALPQYVSPTESPEYGVSDSRCVNTVYWDNKDFSSYHHVIAKEEGATLITTGWVDRSSTYWMSRKVSQWPTSSSIPAPSFSERIDIPDSMLYDFAHGNISPKKYVEKQKKILGAAVDPQTLKHMKKVTEIIQNRIIKLNLRPSIQIRKRRTEFRFSNSDSIEVRLDTDILASRVQKLSEDEDDEEDWNTSDWNKFSHAKISEIASEISQKSVPEFDACIFPMAVVEIRVRNPNIPSWLQNILDTTPQVETHDFSKFVHATALLYPNYLSSVPRWFVRPLVHFKGVASHNWYMLPSSFGDMDVYGAHIKQIRRDWDLRPSKYDVTPKKFKISNREGEDKEKNCKKEKDAEKERKKGKEGEKERKRGKESDLKMKGSNDLSLELIEFGKGRERRNSDIKGAKQEKRDSRQLLKQEKRESRFGKEAKKSGKLEKKMTGILETNSSSADYVSVVRLEDDDEEDEDEDSSTSGAETKGSTGFFSGIFNRRKTAPSVDLTPLTTTTRVEPKTYFANERTLLQWLNMVVLLGFGSFALVSLSPAGSGAWMGSISLVMSILFALYSLAVYHYRRRAIQTTSREGHYDDRWGPTVLVIVILVYFLATLIITLMSSSSLIILIPVTRDYRIELSDSFLESMASESARTGGISESLQGLLGQITTASAMSTITSWNYDIRGDLSILREQSRVTFYDGLKCELYKNDYFLSQEVSGTPLSTYVKLERHAYDRSTVDRIDENGNHTGIEYIRPKYQFSFSRSKSLPHAIESDIPRLQTVGNLFPSLELWNVIPVDSWSSPVVKKGNELLHMVYGDVDLYFGNNAKKGNIRVLLWVDTVTKSLLHAELSLIYATTSSAFDLNKDEIGLLQSFYSILKSLPEATLSQRTVQDVVFGNSCH